MSTTIIKEDTLYDIANNIRLKNATETQYKPSQMPSAIRDLKNYRQLNSVSYLDYEKVKPNETYPLIDDAVRIHPNLSNGSFASHYGIYDGNGNKLLNVNATSDDTIIGLTTIYPALNPSTNKGLQFLDVKTEGIGMEASQATQIFFRLVYINYGYLNSHNINHTDPHFPFDPNKPYPIFTLASDSYMFETTLSTVDPYTYYLPSLLTETDLRVKAGNDIDYLDFSQYTYNPLTGKFKLNGPLASLKCGQQGIDEFRPAFAASELSFGTITAELTLSGGILYWTAPQNQYIGFHLEYVVYDPNTYTPNKRIDQGIIQNNVSSPFVLSMSLPNYSNYPSGAEISIRMYGVTASPSWSYNQKYGPASNIVVYTKP